MLKVKKRCRYSDVPVCTVICRVIDRNQNQSELVEVSELRLYDLGSIHVFYCLENSKFNTESFQHILKNYVIHLLK